MAFSDPYADVSRYKAQIDKLTSDDDTVILSQLKAVSRWLERKLGVVSFNQDATATARVLIAEAGPDGYAQNVLLTPPIASSTGLEVKVDTDSDGDFSDETALPAADYELLPRDALLRTEVVPYTSIALTSWGAYGFTWPIRSRVQVTAVWGWPVVPEAIVNACVEMTAMLRGESPYFTGRINEMDQVQDASPQARSVLKSLMMVYSPTGGIAIG